MTPAHDPLAELGRRERQIMNIVYRLGRATVNDVLKNLDDAPSYSSVRTMLRYLEGKGFLQHDQVERSYVYSPTLKPDRAQRGALRDMVRTFFGGSRARAVAALLDVDEGRVSDDDLTHLRALIDQAKKGESRR